MRKFFHKKIVSVNLFIALLLSVFGNQDITQASEFSDVNENTKNYEAIIYLQKNSIIQGYQDGTFKPNKSVNRAEFLKIIIEGSHIPLDINDEVPFSDIDYSAWYVPYVKKAFAEGWINGYTDGTFKPGQTINKVEALKILGKAQNWPIESIDPSTFDDLFEDIDSSAWYAPYIAYAKINEYIEETGLLFTPGNQMTRGGISEIIYRTLTATKTQQKNNKTTKTSSEKIITIETDSETKTNTIKNTDEPKIKPETTTIPNPSPDTNEIPAPTPEPEPNFTPISFKVIPTSAYDNISLAESLPNIFYKNEIYIVSGDTLYTPYDKATIILDNEDQTIHKAFVGTVTNNHFEIPIHFSKSGNYYLGLIPGESGSSKAYQISVLKEPPSPTNPETNAPSPITSFNITYAKDKTVVGLETGNDTFKKIVFTQNNNSVIYFSRQNTKTMDVQYGDFKNFKPGDVSYYIETAYISSKQPLSISSGFSVSQSKTFNAVEHSFDALEKNEIEVNVPDTILSPSAITLNGTLKIDTKIQALVIKPDGIVDKVTLVTTDSTGDYFGTPIIKNGSNFSFTYTPTTTGRYIIEINNKNSEASLNHPIYIGNIIPLIPDYFDTNERELFTGTLDLNKERQSMLDLINQDRIANGLNSIVLSDELNNLAQGHSDDMKNNNFFSHYNLSNQSPDDRRIAKGIKTPVSENIAKDVSVTFAHYGFMRSASHRENILTPEWTRVGLGITLTEGQLIITQEFSTSQLTATDLLNYNAELLNEINKKRTANSLSALNYSTTLENAGKSLNSKVITTNSAVTNEDFTNALNSNNIFGSSQLLGRTGNPWKTILDSILTEEPSLLQSIWKLIGIDIETDQTGKIHTIIIINSGS